MNIAIIHELAGAGAARCARDLERELGRRHRVRFFPRDGSDDAGSILDALAADPPDIVNCHSFYGSLPYEFLQWVSARFPVVFTVHDPRPIGTIDTICWDCNRNDLCLRCPMVRPRWRKVLANPFRVQRAKKRRVHARCSTNRLELVAPSRWMQGRLARQETARFRMHHIPYGIDLERFRIRPPSRERFGLPDGVPIVLHLAYRHDDQPSYNRRKGLQELAQAFEEVVLPRIPGAKLAIAGENVIPNRHWAIGLGMVEQDDVPDLLSSVDLFVTATLADNLPYTVLEAMGCGRAVVANAVGGVPEQIEPGRTGLLVPPRDVQALGEAIASLLADAGALQDYGNAGRARAEEHFGMDRFVASYENLFRRVAAEGRGDVPSDQPGMAPAGPKAD